MILAPAQKKRLAVAISEALAYKVECGELRVKGMRPTFERLDADRKRLKVLGVRLMEVDATHRAIVDRCVAAIEEGLL